MQLKSIQPLFFSPTKNTKKYCLRIAYYLGSEISSIIDLTLHESRKNSIQKVNGDLILVGAPIYSGRIPDQFLQKLNSIKGENQLCVALVVNGNVNLGKALEELVWILKRQGFKVIAAATFTGRHSFSYQQFPLAINRPDNEDFQKLRQFCQELSQKIRKIPSDPSENTLKPFEINMKNPNINYSLPHPQYRVQTMVQAPVRDEEKCISCRECYAACPVNAIDFNSLMVDDKSCIRCFACFRTCKSQARQITLNLPSNSRKRFEDALRIRMEPQWYL